MPTTPPSPAARRRPPQRPVTDNPVSLRSVWAAVHGLRVHARASEAPVPAQRLPVVLVHGLGVSGRYLEPAALRLAPSHRVYVPDLPGFGRSDKPAATLTVPELADALAAWMGALGLPRAAFLGNSLGCQAIVNLALRHPGRVERAVLVGPTLDPEARSLGVQAARCLLDLPGEPPSLWPILARDYWAAGLRRTLGTLRHALADRMEDHLPRVRVPVLVIRGARDTITPARWAERAARLLPRGRLAVIPRAYHAAHYSHPDEVARLARRFFRERP